MLNSCINFLDKTNPNNNDIKPKPIFVVGSPRSGTTMLGAYIGSAPQVTYMGEYAGFDMAHRDAENELSNMPSPYIRDYLNELKSHARDFADRVAYSNGNSWFCDSATWNLCSVKSISNSEPDAIFILSIRDARGVMQSLERSYDNGYLWAGEQDADRLKVWIDFYKEAQYIPNDRLILFNYDNFCKNPDVEVEKLVLSLEKLGFPASTLDSRVFTESHANAAGNDMPVSAKFNENGRVVFKSKLSLDKSAWSTDQEDLLCNHDGYKMVASILENLQLDDYEEPDVSNKLSL